ncbi:MAG: PHP domain-containing protein, partial [Exilispira sp.]
MQNKKLKKADMHVHSCFSQRPSNWILKTIGTRESYVDPFEIYKFAKSVGMDYVTITDHNSIDGILKLKE